MSQEQSHEDSLLGAALPIDTVFRTEFRQKAKVFNGLDIDEDAYVLSRRCDFALGSDATLAEQRAVFESIASDATSRLFKQCVPTDEELRKEYRAHADQHLDNQVSEETYILSRKIDLGLQPLLP